MNCPNCQAPLVPGATFCVQCGTRLVPDAPEAAPPTPAPEAAPAYPAAPPPPMSAPVSYQPLTSPPAQPAYSAPPPQPTYGQPLTPSAQPAYSTPPSQPPYGQPAYTAPPSQPLYTTPPSQPVYAPPPSQPLYGQPAAPSQPLFTTVFGPDADPMGAPAAPSTPLQEYMTRNLPRQYALNKWFTALLGAIAAVISGLILTALAQSLWGNAIKGLLGLAPTPESISSTLDSYGQALLTPDLLKLFAIEHHVPLVISASVSAAGPVNASLGGDVTLNLPLTGLIIIPALALTLGGYVSATSGYTRQARYAIARGALIAPFYAVATAILAAMGSSSISGGLLSESGSVTIAPAVFPAVIYGLLWGAIFGALGGWIHHSGRAWLSSAVQSLQSVQTLQRKRAAGAVAGAVAAYLCGVLLFIAAGIGGIAFLLIHTAATTTINLAQLQSGTQGNPALIAFLAITMAPVLAVWALAVASGAPLQTFTSIPGGSGSSGATSIGLFGTHQAIPGLLWLILLIPAIAYIAGGRIAARVAQADRPDSAFIAGALMAVPLSIITAAAAWLTSVSFDINFLGQSGSVGFSPSIGGTFLAVLIFGAVAGGIGGVSYLRAPGLGELPRIVLIPFRPIGAALNPLLDRLTGAPAGQPRSAARRWVYDAVLAAVILGVATIVLDIINTPLAPTAPFSLLSGLDQWVGALLGALPICYLIGALMVSFTGSAQMPATAASASGGIPVAVPVTAPGSIAFTYPPATSGQMPGYPPQGVGGDTPQLPTS